MSVNPLYYGHFMESMLEGRVNFTADDLWCMLVTNSYIFNQDTHKFKSIVTGEIVGSGYSAGGQKVATGDPVYSSITNLITVPASNLVWPIVTWTGAVGAVMYMNPDDFPENAKPLVAYIDFGTTINRADEAFYINWSGGNAIKMNVP